MNHRQKLAYWKRIYKARKLQKGECDACWLLLGIVAILASIAVVLIDTGVIVR